jgi:Uma2 family endonuclease
MNATAALTRMSIRFNGWEVRDTRPPYSDNEFFDLCFQNPDLRIEQDVDGNTIVMAPVSFDSGNFESEFQIDLGIWNRTYKLGKTFSSATLFILPNGEKRMPDAAWITHEKVNAMPPEERKRFAHIAPDFVVEIRSPSDDLGELQTKMRDSWIGNGVQLAWLIDPEQQTAWVYRADGTVETIEDFHQCLSGEEVLPGFELSLLLFIG